MRKVSAELAAAVEAPEQTVRARVSVDWAGDGHGPAGSIDDLSSKAASVRVASVLQGTQPEQVNVVEGTAAATLDVDLTAGDTDDERLQAVRYFSPFAADSALYGLERLNRDVQVDAEILTSEGWQGVPLFRGVTRALPVRVADRRASLTGVDYRAKLRQVVTLPAMAADIDAAEFAKPGLEGTWIVSYILWQCGFPLSPLPPAGCRLWVPMHGSAMPFISLPLQGSPAAYLEHIPSSGTGPYYPLEFAEGPHVLGVRDAKTAGLPSGTSEHWFIQYQPFAGAAMFASDGRSAGRVTAWVKAGNELNVHAFNDRGDDVTWRPTLPTTLTVGNNGVFRNIVGPRPPDDGRWHLCGAHWDDAAGVATFHMDGALTTVAFTPTPSAPGADDAWIVNVDGVAALAELQISTGVAVTEPWPPLAYAASAVVDRCPTPIDGIVSPLTGEAWELLQELAETWQGAVYLDAYGTLHVTTRARLVSTAAQVTQRQLTAERHLFELAWDFSLDRVANVVSAGYQPVAITSQAEVWRLSGTYLVQPATSISIEASFNGVLATAMRVLTGHANTAANGSGTSYLVSQVVGAEGAYATVEYTSEAGATVRVYNNSGVPLWLVDTTGQPDLRINGDVISQGTSTNPVVARNQASINTYGEQPIDLPATRWTQRRDVAGGMAMATAGDLYQPKPVFEELPVPLDPRLEPYDRVRVVDAGNTAVTLDVWVVGRTHELGAGVATTTLAARPARDRYLAGVGLAGVDLVG